jgi:predicted DNA-binding protein (MmcQ/YjbR family)
MSEEYCPPAEEHPVFRELFEYSAAKPDAKLDHPWGDTVFKVGGKIFVYLGRNAVGVKPYPEELELLLGRPDVSPSPYIGRFGWITLRIEDDDTLALAKSLIDDTYEQIAAKTKRKREREKAAAGSNGSGASSGGRKKSPAKASARGGKSPRGGRN